jgi:hypothetical protein
VFISGSLAVVGTQFLLKVEFLWGGKPHFSLQQKESLLMKTKLFVAAVMFFSFTLAAYAATQYTVGSTPVTTVVESGKTEKTGDITFATVPNAGATVTGTITLDYRVPITYIPPNAIQEIVAGDGLTVPSISNPTPVGALGTATKITFAITPSATTPSLDYSFRLTGIRVDVADNPGAVPMKAYISTTGNTIVVNQTDPQVINEKFAGIANFTGTAAVRINTVTGDYEAGSPQGVEVTATEGFVNAFGVTTLGDSTQLNTQRMEIRLDKQIPPGITVTFPPTDSTSRWRLLGSGTLNNASGAAPKVYYEIYNDTNVVAIDLFKLSSVTIGATTGPSSAYIDQVINASISLAPVYNETGSENAVPRYKYVPVGTVPLITFFSPTTTLLIPFVQNDDPALVAAEDPVFGTGFAIANTTKDPGTGMGFAGAVQQAGRFTFYLYSDAGVVTTVSSTALPAKGILSGGSLAAGKTYTVLLSEVLAAATPAAIEQFKGYVFIVCQFTNAHGEYFISDWETFTHGALMLVVQGSRAGASEGLNN